MLDQVEEGRLSPMDVVEHDHKWSPARKELEEATDRPERLLGDCAVRRQAEDLTHPLEDELTPRVVLAQAPQLGRGPLRSIALDDAGRLPDDLDDRPERD